MYQKLKSFLEHDTYYFTALILLVGIASFGLGRQSVAESLHVQQSLQPGTALQVLAPLSIVPVNTETSQSVSVIASKSGTKYHLPDCPGAGQIKPENRIEFASVAEAEAAGYSPASNCPGL